MKQIILKYIDCDIMTHYAILEEEFSFDYCIECGIIFLSFYNSDGEEILSADTSYLNQIVFDSDVLECEDFHSELDSIILSTSSKLIENYLVNDVEILDVNILMDSVSVCTSECYKRYLDSIARSQMRSK